MFIQIVIIYNITHINRLSYYNIYIKNENKLRFLIYKKNKIYLKNKIYC